MLITQSEFARRVKVSPQAITKAIRSGRLTLIAGKLDEKVAALQWNLNRQRPAPPSRYTAAPDWSEENTALWIVLLLEPERLPVAARRWLTQATGGPPPAKLQERFNGLLRELAGNIGRIRRRAPDEKPVADAH
jgi:hypothetical protein